jgi:hypothetical protein
MAAASLRLSNLLLGATVLLACHDASLATALGEETPRVKPPPLERFHDTVQGSVRRAARVLDSFFAEEQYESERNDTSLLLRFDVQAGDPDVSNLRFRPRLRLRLPGTERTLLFEIQGSSETVEDGTAVEREPIFEETVQEDRFEASLKLFETDANLLLTPEVGFGFDGGDPRVFAGGRARYRWKTGSAWSFLASQRLRLDSARELEAISLLRADRLIWDDTLWRNDVEVGWRRDRDGLSYRPIVSFFEPIDDRSAMAVEGSLLFRTEPHHELRTVAAAMRYRRKVLTDWSAFEIGPRLAFKAKDDYSATVGLFLRIDLEF